MEQEQLHKNQKILAPIVVALLLALAGYYLFVLKNAQPVTPKVNNPQSVTITSGIPGAPLNHALQGSKTTNVTAGSTTAPEAGKPKI